MTVNTTVNTKYAGTALSTWQKNCLEMIQVFHQ